jgi:hypothetical protein
LDLTTVTNIAEIIASIGVVISLIYIAREFGRNSRSERLEKFGKALETQVQLFAHLVDEPDKAELVRQGLVDVNRLNQGQKGQFSALIHDILLAHDVLRRAYEYGQMPEDDFRIMQDLWISIMRTTGGRQWWAGWKAIMPLDVVNYVESTVDDQSIKTKPLNEAVPWLFAIEDESDSTLRS